MQVQTRILFNSGKTLDTLETAAAIMRQMKDRDGYATVTFLCDQTPTGIAEFTIHDRDVEEFDGLCNVD